jgi:hypothetical protein
MKFKLDATIKGFDGQEFDNNGRSLNVEDVVKFCLRAPALYEAGQNAGTPRPLSPADLSERESLISAMKDGYLDITAEQATRLIKLVGASGVVPEIAVQFSAMLNGGGQSI